MGRLETIIEDLECVVDYCDTNICEEWSKRDGIRGYGNGLEHTVGEKVEDRLKTRMKG